MGTNKKINRFVEAMLSGEPQQDGQGKAQEQAQEPEGVDMDKLLHPEVGEVPEETKERLQISPELLEALNKERVKKSGRPRKDGERPTQETGTKEGETRATFIVDKALLKKIKYISVMETKLHKDIVNEALSKYIAEWEAENGKIKIKK